MRVNQYRTLLEIQALQNMNGTNKSNNNLTTFSSIFQQTVGTPPSPNVENNLFNHPLNSATTESLLPLLQMSLEPLNTNTTLLTKTNYDDIIKEASEKYNVDAKLIKSVIQHESNFNPNAKSHAGAMGLMQLMPATARGLGVMNPFDSRENILGGTKYLRQMLDRFDGDIKLSLAAYNAGPGNVDKYGGIPPFRETQQYVQKVFNHYKYI